jgi:hypothetical protein
MKYYSEHLQATGIKPDHISKYAHFEAADPVMFCQRGQAIINCDIPGLQRGRQLLHIPSKHNLSQTLIFALLNPSQTSKFAKNISLGSGLVVSTGLSKGLSI